MENESLEAVRERERERDPQFSKINEENKGIKFAFICDRLKDRDKASLLLKEILYISKVIIA